MLWAAASLYFLRSGAITIPTDSDYDSSTHISFTDVAVDNLASPTMLKLHLKASKTDLFRKGVDVKVGKVASQLYPVKAVLGYLVVRGSGQGSLFQFEDKKPYTRVCFVSRVREALQKAGVDCKAYSGHSFRTGVATTAAKAGVEDSVIKMLGRWKSNAYQLYIKNTSSTWQQYRVS